MFRQLEPTTVQALVMRGKGDNGLADCGCHQLEKSKDLREAKQQQAKMLSLSQNSSGCTEPQIWATVIPRASPQDSGVSAFLLYLQAQGNT